MQLIIKGTRKEITGDDQLESGLKLEHEFNLTGDIRSAAKQEKIQLEAHHVVQLEFGDALQPVTWLCGQDTLNDIFPEKTPTRSLDGEDGFELPGSIQGPALERGLVQDIAIKAIKIFSKKAVDTGVKALARKFEEKELGVADSTLLSVDSSFATKPYTKTKSTKPYLLFLHGTASSTTGSFDKLMPRGDERSTGVWQYMCQTYGSNIIAFQHRTLSESPLQNVLDLINQLPDVATLDLISHSRGGLVGDILCRFCTGDQKNAGFSDDEIDVLRRNQRTGDIDNINKIKTAISKKQITVRRFVRVACPAAGTILASERLDNFFNIAGNLLGHSIVSSIFRELLAAVVNTKNNVDVLPGIEAMDPDSPLIKVLNNRTPKVNIDSRLIVISGNCKVGLSLGALAVIAGKLFFQRNNDLVVHSSSMYQGAKRAAQTQYFFDENTDVNHFSYFKNERTQIKIMAALKQTDDTLIEGFKILLPGDPVLSRNIGKIEGGEVYMDKVSGKRPIAIVLPGIMGSNLRVDDNLSWINYLRMITGGLKKLDIDNQAVASSIVKSSYADLANQLSSTYDVITFPFDWRRPLPEAAAKLNDKIKSLLQLGQPIKIVAHSMGGVLVRDFIVNHSDTWQTLNNSKGFRLVFLGAPLGGSFRIAAVLFGQDSIINTISRVDLAHSKKDLINIFRRFPGLLNLLPFTEDTNVNLGNAGTWATMRSASGDDKWPVPDNQAIKDFANYRTAAKKVMDTIDFSNAIYIAGKSDATPCGFRIDKKSTGDELVFLYTGEGDQSVTWESGIPPSMIAKGLVYYANVSHGALSCDKQMLPAIAEILQKGSTDLLRKKRPATRATEKVFSVTDLSGFDLSETGVTQTLLGIEGPTPVDLSEDEKIEVSVSNGELRYSRYPVLVGHFNGDGIMNAERAVDKQLNRLLSKRHALGLHPGIIGESDVLIPAEGDFPGSVVVGLGNPGRLTEYELTKTVEQGIMNYLLFLDGNKNNATIQEKLTGISSLAIGCGYGGLSIESSIHSIIEGVYNANRKMRQVQGQNARTVRYIEFVEKFEDNAVTCFYSLHKFVREGNKMVTIPAGNNKIKTLIGQQKRFPKDQSMQWWNRINVVTEIADYGSNGTANTVQNDTVIKKLRFSASTGAAREEQRELYSNSGIVNTLIDEISTNNQWSQATAKTVFELMIPVDFKDQLKRQSHITWILDKDSAAYPWELLHDGIASDLPLAVSAGMVRQLKTMDARVRSTTVTKSTALIIADPNLQRFAPQLPAALEEGRVVSGIIKRNGYITTNCFPDATAIQIIKSLFADEYKIVHIAAHGLFDAEHPERSGIVIGNNIFLSTREIAQMSTVPELVFINCCYTGRMDGGAEKLYRDRYKLAANIGTQLIENGAKAVVATGWAVNDAAANEFAEKFYHYMFEGESFGEAVHKARRHIFEKYGDTNTWGAYQCYGDPFYTLAGYESNNDDAYTFLTSAEAEVELYNLWKRLDVGKRDEDKYLDELEKISSAITPEIRTARTTELEGLILCELVQYESAEQKFDEAFKMEDADFRFSSLEKYCALLYKKYTTDYLAAEQALVEQLEEIEEMKPQENETEAECERQKKKERQIALQKRDDIRTLLHSKFEVLIGKIITIVQLGKSSERCYLLASAYKRWSLLCTGKEKVGVLKHAAWNYREANAIENSSHSYTNWLEVESMLEKMDEHAWGQETASPAGEKYTLPRVEEAERALTILKANILRPDQDMDYWDMAASINVDICSLIIRENHDAARWKSIGDAFDTAWTKAGSPLKKISEIEHLEFLVLTLSHVLNTKTHLQRREKNDMTQYIKELTLLLDRHKTNRTTAKLKIQEAVAHTPTKKATKKPAAKKAATKKRH